MPRPPWAALYFITFTLKYDPASADDLSVDGLRGRKEIVLAAVRYCWRRYLKARGVAMAISVEVSPRGAVHVHALYCGRRPDINTLRDTYMIRAGESKMVNIKYVRHPHKAICEIAKYIAKAASPKSAALFRGALGEFTDPVLAARIEVAFAGTRLLQCYGAWRGADDESDLPDDTPTPCPLCGVPDHLRPVRLTLADWLKRAPSDWAPRLAREGPAIREFYARHPELKRRRNDNEQR